MANELQDTLSRIIGKSNVLIEKYHAVAAERERLADENALLREQVDGLRIENEKLKRNNGYLAMARDLAPDKESAARTRAIISQLVRDIDRCIAQLNE